MNEKPRHRPNTALKSSTGIASRRHRPDYWLLVLSGLLLSFGLIVVYSISPGLSAAQHVSQNYFITKQLIDVGLGALTFAIAAYLPISFWKQAAKPLALAAIVGSLIVLFTPLNATYQAHRWLRLGGFSFQIAELIKLALVVGVAKLLADAWNRRKLNDSSATLKPLLYLLIAIGLVVAKLQSDLGSAGVMVAVIGAMPFTAGIPLKKVLLAIGLIAIMLVLAVSTSSYRRERLATYLHPGSNCQGSGYQACQALISVGSGGVFGLGLGYSVQAYGYLPEASNDSIFAIIAEKFGFIGTTAIVVLYGVFISRLKRIIERTADQFSRLIVVGVLAWFSTQAIINVGAMLGLLPLKGITLPLISQGGTSLICLTAALGIVFQISRYTSYRVISPNEGINETQNYSPDGRRVGRPYNAATITRPRT